ncbi:8-oxoguanine glycosylase ogg1 [Marasmius tenuissimus]|uniref:DNA-(apurinic or apyrimidinic site) lyase n=1 Tax=Marasmius tenuissimus TaxID=585030 RepID=A0ABR2ZSL7_9AGAR
MTLTTTTTTTSAIPAGFKALPLSILQLSLSAVLKCGQSFRWHCFSESQEYRLCLLDRVVCLRQTPTSLLYRTFFPDPQPFGDQILVKDAETLVWLKDYFQLDIDLLRLYDEWSLRDKVFMNVKDRFSGIRMLRQDPWENLISFICSSNNNISRISKMVQNLCKEFSPPLINIQDPGSMTSTNYHAFPPPSVLADPDVASKLRSLGFGYRAEFIQKTARMLFDAHGNGAETWLMKLREASTEEARAELLKLMGVGRKVADCILLMSLDKKEVIPCDTHVHQIAVKHYGVKSSSGKSTMSPKLYEEINTKLVNVWGPYAGWAHSVGIVVVEICLIVDSQIPTKVLFTSDLKSFSSYGVTPTPSPQTSPKKRARQTQESEQTSLPIVTDTTKLVTSESVVVEASVAERVKRRRR